MTTIRRMDLRPEAPDTFILKRQDLPDHLIGKSPFIIIPRQNFH